MAQPQINLGSSANDGTGDDLRTAGAKINKILRGEFQVVVDYFGSELVTDGNLATDPALSGWTMNDAVWSVGQIVAAYSSNAPAFVVPIVVENGATYLIEFTQTALANDITSIHFDNAAPRVLAGKIGLNGVLFVAANDGAENVHFDFDQYRSGATHTITSVSIRKIADPDSPLTALDVAGTSHLALGMYNGNVALGRGANDDAGYNNINFGPFAGHSLSVGYSNINIGELAGCFADSTNNVNIGAYAGYNGGNSQNVNVGNAAGYSLTTGAQNVNVGASAGNKIVGGGNNVSIGSFANSSGTSGNNNICIGAGTDVASPTANDQINIGNVITSDGVLTRIAQPLNLTGATPANANASGTAGTVLWDSGFIYVCVATDTWKRAAIATW